MDIDHLHFHLSYLALGEQCGVGWTPMTPTKGIKQIGGWRFFAKCGPPCLQKLAAWYVCDFSLIYHSSNIFSKIRDIGGYLCTVSCYYL